MKASYLKHHLELLKNLKRSPNWMNSPKQKPISTYQVKFRIILEHHPDHQYVFTDGSKDND